MVTTIQVEEDVKKKLDSIKLHHRESYNELIVRMLKSFSAGNKESLIETIEVLSDPEAMRDIAKGIEDYKKGRTITLEEAEKELGISG